MIICLLVDIVESLLKVFSKIFLNLKAETPNSSRVRRCILFYAIGLLFFKYYFRFKSMEVKKSRKKLYPLFTPCTHCTHSTWLENNQNNLIFISFMCFTKTIIYFVTNKSLICILLFFSWKNIFFKLINLH